MIRKYQFTFININWPMSPYEMRVTSYSRYLYVCYVAVIIILSTEVIQFIIISDDVIIATTVSIIYVWWTVQCFQIS